MKKSKDKNRKIAEIPAWKNLVAQWLGRVLFFASIYALLVNVISWLMPPIGTLLSSILLLFGLPRDFSIFNAVVLFILSAGIRHRRRLAMWVEVIYFQIAFVLFGGAFLFFYFSGMLTQADLADTVFSTHVLVEIILSVVASLGTAILIIASQEAFPTKALLGKWWKAVSVVVGGFVLSIVAGLGMSFLTYHGLVSVGQRFFYVGKEAVSDFRYLLPFGEDFFPYQSANNLWVSMTVSVIMLLGFVLGFLMFTRSSQKELFSSAEQELAVRQLVLDYGEADSLAYFATRRDKVAVFSKNKKAAITYQLFGSVLLASGDPIGQKSAWKNAGEQFLALARQNGWSPAAVGSSKEGAEFYQQLGLNSVAFGDEAVVLVDDFSVENRGMHDVAQVMRRAEREQYSVKIRYQSELSKDELHELEALSDTWRDGEERGYSMTTNRFGDPTDAQIIIVTAHDQSDNVMGILSFVPVGAKGLSLDVMRRSPELMNGVVTFMITSLIEYGKTHSIKEISLNFAAARHFFVQGQEPGATPADRIMRRVMLFFSRWYQLESLFRSNDIYQPEWRRRYICYDKSGTLTSVLFTIGQAEGFVPVDPFSRVRRLFQRHQFSERQWWKEEKFIDQVHQQEEKHAQEAQAQALPAYAENRMEKLEHLRELGIEPYAQQVPRSRSIADLRTEYAGQESFDETLLTLVGRLVNLRGRGALCFADLADADGQIQIMLKRDTLNGNAEAEGRKEDFAVWKSDVTVGDLVAVEGTLMLTKTGELSLKVERWQMIAKSLLVRTDEEKAQEEQARKVLNLLVNLKEKLLKANFVEVNQNALEMLGLGYSRVFEAQKDELSLYSVKVEGVDFLQELGDLFETELEKVSGEEDGAFLLIKAGTQEVGTFKAPAYEQVELVRTDASLQAKKAFEQGLPPFEKVTLSLTAFLESEAVHEDENEDEA